MCQGPLGLQWSMPPQSDRHLLLKYWPLPFSLSICCSASLSLASFQDHPPLHWPLWDWDWGLFSGSIKTSWLTHSHGQWCLEKDFRGISWDRPSAHSTLTLPIYSQELPPQARPAPGFLQCDIFPQPVGTGFSGVLVLVPHHYLLPLPSCYSPVCPLSYLLCTITDPNAFGQPSVRDPSVSSLDARVVSSLSPSP